MATYYESAYKQLLMGVSQQDPKDRIEGQLTEQKNMTSDPVYGLRRRSPVKLEGFAEGSVWALDQVAILNTHLSGQLCWVIVSILGDVGVLRSDGLFTWGKADDYFKAKSKAAIRFTTLNNKIYICNVEQAPKEVQSAATADFPDPQTRGFWSVQAAAFSTRYVAKVTFLDDKTSVEVDYSTPDSTGGSAAVAEATLANIASHIAVQLNGKGGLEAIGAGNTVCINSHGRPISVSTGNPHTMVHVSNNSRVRVVEDLPPYLDVEYMNNYIITVGTGSKLTYYRYDLATKVWLEDAAYGSSTELTNMPVALSYLGGDNWSLDHGNYPRRSAGDSNNNPTPKFVENGITGMGVFQGRLVLLASEYVCMSASGQPGVWYRTTVDSLDPSDPIEIAGSDNTSSDFVHTTLFNKDLVIYGADVQAIIPGTQAITPSNAVVGIMSRYKCTLYVPPINSGQSQYVGATRGDGYGSIWEIVPSDFQTSQIVAVDVTRHIPSYVRGTARIITASTTSSIVAAAFTGDDYTLLIQEYLVDGNEKKQAAWHKWVFAKPILHAVFEQDTLYILFNEPKMTIVASIDLRRGSHNDSIGVPRIDFHKTYTADADDSLVIDLFFYNMNFRHGLQGFKLTGQGVVNTPVSLVLSRLEGQKVYCQAPGVKKGDEIVVGSKYMSSFTLTPPKIVDGNGAAITMYKATLQQFHVNWAYTGPITYSFADKYRQIGEDNATPCLLKQDLKVENFLPLRAVRSKYPVGLDMNDLIATFSTDGVYDMCPTLVEYGYRYNQVRGRRV